MGTTKDTSADSIPPSHHDQIQALAARVATVEELVKPLTDFEMSTGQFVELTASSSLPAPAIDLLTEYEARLQHVEFALRIRRDNGMGIEKLRFPYNFSRQAFDTLRARVRLMLGALFGEPPPDDETTSGAAPG